MNNRSKMTVSQGYQGMRWYKCDLHLHTPEDARHWRDSQETADKDKIAKAFIRRCFEEGLECIAITDHNFRSKNFIPRLQDAAIRFEKEYGYQMIIFPGFEIIADVGRGIHVLAIFEPDTLLEDIDHILTLCDVPRPRQDSDGTNKPSSKRLNDILEIVQKKKDDDRLGGIVILPHIVNDSGLFDNARISGWLQALEWQNPDLFAVEIPKPIREMNKNWQRLFDNGDDCEKKWRRIRPIAGIMSSDCKALDSSGDQDNYIGKRYSWIKMSRPSIESLRQAFLDPTSRLCLDPGPPPVDHTHISSISVKGTKFLEDQTVHFSPHLNCIIGGRGSGKSMLFESLRLGLRGEVTLDLSEKSIQVAKEQIQRLWKTFTPQTHIEVTVSHADLEDKFVVNEPRQPAQVQKRQVDDPPTVFRNLNPLIFSQEEITELTSRQKTLIEFIDNLVREQLEEHRQEANAIIDRLKKAHREEEVSERIEGELNSLRQEVGELGRQLEAREKVQDELKKHRAAQEAQRYIDLLNKETQEIEERMMSLADEWETGPPTRGSRLDDFPLQDFLTRAEEKVSRAYHELVESLRSSARGFREKIDQTLDKQGLAKVREAITRAENDFETACGEKGLTQREAEHLKEIELQYRSKKAAVQAKKTERDNLEKQKTGKKELFDKLTQCWLQETRVRQEFLEEILGSAAMPRTDNQPIKPIIQVLVTFAGNRGAFLETWGELAPDRRTSTGRAWDNYDSSIEKNNIGDQLFIAFCNYVEKQNSPGESDKTSETVSGDRAGNPIQWLELHLEKPHDLPPLVRDNLEAIKLVRKEKYDLWFQLLIKRIPDSADLELFRRDGTPAGSFVKNDLSTGQKNTAILSLLLAAGKGPVLIDQPEDQLDSEFLFQELVPMIRDARKERQLIIITHNANIPVNADAELVYALEARAGHGKCRTQGGLDRKETAKAVLDIMEGSEEAFRRRKEKYHF